MPAMDHGRLVVLATCAAVCVGIVVTVVVLLRRRWRKGLSTLEPVALSHINAPTPSRPTAQGLTLEASRQGARRGLWHGALYAPLQSVVRTQAVACSPLPTPHPFEGTMLHMPVHSELPQPMLRGLQAEVVCYRL
jgi:hypothetical protein